MGLQAQSGRREASRRRMYRQRRLAVLALIVGCLLVLGVAFLSAGTPGGGGAPPAGPGQVAPPPAPELPRGGRRLFPEHRLVGYYGAPQAEELGILGIGEPAEAARKLERQARSYARGGKKVLPTFELIATIASGSPGRGGKYRSRQRPGTVERYLQAAREARALLVLDIQPGREEFLTEVKALEKYLKEPDVGVALDPEWSMGAGEVPGQQIGSTDAATVNEISAYLGDLVKRGNLPEKLLLIHQFTAEMIENKEQLRQRPGVALTVNVDGFGDRAQKLAKYREFTRGSRNYHGLKLFFREDTGLFAPREVLRLRPQPDVVMYE